LVAFVPVLAAYRQELENTPVISKTRRGFLEWHIRGVQKTGNFFCWLIIHCSALACRFVAASITPGTATARCC